MKTFSTAARHVYKSGPIVLVALSLAGCITLFPKAKPSQLYRFGPPVPATAPAVPTGAFAVRLAPIGFPIPTAADKIMTVNGEEVAYIAGGRWVTAAANLFEAAVVQTFEARGGAARLLARGELTPAPYALKLDVRHFEVRYEQGAASAPTVLVEVYAALDNATDPKQDRERVFIERAPAADNRMGPIVSAFDQAVGKACADVVDWTNAKGG